GGRKRSAMRMVEGQIRLVVAGGTESDRQAGGGSGEGQARNGGGYEDGEAGSEEDGRSVGIRQTLDPIFRNGRKDGKRKLVKGKRKQNPDPKTNGNQKRGEGGSPTLMFSVAELWLAGHRIGGQEAP